VYCCVVLDTYSRRVVADEGFSAKSLKRPGLLSAPARLDAGKADYLMAIRLDRVSRSVSDFAGLLDRASKKGWDLTLLSPNIDTSDPAGRFTANVLASAAQYERELIGVRTREGMAQRRLEGVRLGRPRTMSTEVVARIQGGRLAGLSLRQIARRPERRQGADRPGRVALACLDCQGGPRRLGHSQRCTSSGLTRGDPGFLTYQCPGHWLSRVAESPRPGAHEGHGGRPA
jgi:Resolvase, N terminal domain